MKSRSWREARNNRMSAEFRFMHSNHAASNLPLADDGYQLTIRLMEENTAFFLKK